MEYNSQPIGVDDTYHVLNLNTISYSERRYIFPLLRTRIRCRQVCKVNRVDTPGFVPGKSYALVNRWPDIASRMSSYYRKWARSYCLPGIWACPCRIPFTRMGVAIAETGRISSVICGFWEDVFGFSLYDYFKVFCFFSLLDIHFHVSFLLMISICNRKHAYIHTHTHIRIHTRLHTIIHKPTHAHAHTRTYIHTRTHIYTHTHTYIYICVYIH